MHISNDYIQNSPFFRLKLVVETLNTKLVEPTKQNSIKVPKVVMPTNKKTLLENFGDYQLSPLSLIHISDQKQQLLNKTCFIKTVET